MGSTDPFTRRPASPPQGGTEGPLAGKTVAVRPDLSVRRRLTDAGSKALAGFRAVEDATVVARLKAAGASLAGSTRMAELGFGINGETLPQVLTAGQADLGIVTDTLGEARMAACMAGWFGFKPSYGVISRFGLVGLVPSMECIGVLAREPADLAAVLAVMAGQDEQDFSMSPDPPPGLGDLQACPGPPGRVGVPRECHASLDPSEAEAFARALETLSEAGFEVHDVSLTGFDLFPVVHQIIGSVEASSAAGKYDGVRYGFRADSAGNWNEMYLRSRAGAFGTRIKAFLFQGAHFQFEDYPAFERACVLRRRLVEETDELFGRADLLALPTRHHEPDPFRAETVRDTYAAFRLTLAASVAGLPALHVPGLNLDAGTDLGLQLVGPRLGDARVLAAGMTLSPHIQGDPRTCRT